MRFKIRAKIQTTSAAPIADAMLGGRIESVVREAESVTEAICHAERHLRAVDSGVQRIEILSVERLPDLEGFTGDE